jgi:hypothetical protein
MAERWLDEFAQLTALGNQRFFPCQPCFPPLKRIVQKNMNPLNEMYIQMQTLFMKNDN